MTGVISIADAIDRHQVRLLWAGPVCIAFTYPPGRSNAISGSGASVRDAVRDLLANMGAREQRRPTAPAIPRPDRGAPNYDF